MRFRVTWTDAAGELHIEHFATRTEATVRMYELRREGIEATVVGMR